MKWIYPLSITLVIIYLVIVDFKLNDFEFILITMILIFVLVKITESTSTECFDGTMVKEEEDIFPERLALYDVPNYASKTIGNEIDKLIKDAKPKDEDNKMTDDVIGKNTVEDDTDMLNAAKQVDEAKFAMLRREYLNVNTMLLALKDSMPDVYARIFGTTNEENKTL